jgi:hypothetical protein
MGRKEGRHAHIRAHNGWPKETGKDQLTHYIGKCTSQIDSYTWCQT